MQNYIKSFKHKILNKWVYLKKHEEPELWWSKVKIKDVDLDSNRVIIQISKDRIDTVKFDQISPIPYTTEKEIIKLQEEFDLKMQYWNSTAKDKLKNPEDERCDWLYHKTKTWFIPTDRERLIESMSFNINCIDYLQNIISMININNDKNRKFHAENGYL